MASSACAGLLPRAAFSPRAEASVRYEGREYGQGTNAEINFYLKGRKSSFETISE